MKENYIILEGKNYDSLVEEALNKLGVKKDEINVEILEKKKSLFSSSIKIKVSLKAIKTVEMIEKRLEKIYTDSLSDIDIDIDIVKNKQNAVEFLYKEDGVYIKLNKSITIEDAKSKIEMKKISNANLEQLTDAINKNKLHTLIKIAEKQEEAKVDSKCRFRFDADNQNAYIYVNAPSGGKDITEEAIYNALKENKIIFGVNDEEVISIAKNKLYDVETKIAEGIEPFNGESAKLQYHFDTNIETKLLEDEGGKIDFRELSIIKNVKAGQVLVTLIPASAGIPGRSVLGEDIQTKEGKRLVLPKGKNVSITEDGLSLISNIDGEVKLIDAKVNVFSVYEVPANVDNSTGNVRFLGKVVVNGNVITGFTVEAEGDVEVYGVVEGAKIISKGNIILHRGIQGMNKGELYCDGDLVAKFIENSVIEVKGNINSDAIMHSHVVCGKKLVVSGRKGLLVGGSFKVSDEIKAKVIGSPMATVTELEVGVNPDLRKRYEQLKQEKKSINENLAKVKQAVDMLTKISQKVELPPDKSDLLAKSIQAKNQLTLKLDANSSNIKEMETFLDELSKGKVKVSGVIYPGVRLTIGSSMMYIKDPFEYLTLYRENAEIKIGPYEN